MNKQERISRILERITEDKAATILSTRALAAEFAVSEITMRRDLQELADAGLIQRRHGGVLGVSRRVNGHNAIGIVVVSFQGKSSHPFYLDGIAEQDLEKDADLCFRVIHTLERLPPKIGREGAEYLMSLPKPPDAIMCSSDMIALGAMQWLQAAGYKIPDDVAVTGFDNIPDAQVAFPPLTTVHLHKHLLGRLAAEQVHRRIVQPDDPPLTIVTPTSLVIRRSCGA